MAALDCLALQDSQVSAHWNVFLWRTICPYCILFWDFKVVADGKEITITWNQNHSSCTTSHGNGVWYSTDDILYT